MRTGTIQRMNRLALAAASLAARLRRPRRRPRAPAGRSPPGRAEAGAKVRIALKNVNGSKVDVGSKILGVGYVRPFVPNQEVRVWVAKAKNEVARQAPDDQARSRQEPGPLQDPLEAPDRGRHLPGPGEEEGLRRTRRASRPSRRKVGISYPDLDPGMRNNDVDLFNDLLSEQALLHVERLELRLGDRSARSSPSAR